MADDRSGMARITTLLPAVILLAAAIAGCKNTPGSSVPSTTLKADYIVLAWNDLGMHCLNPTYDKAVILPPYNTVWAQVVKRGTPPQVVTDGLTVTYTLVGNTSSSSKRSYGQFWTNAGKLFGAAGLAKDTGLNLEDPSVHNGLAGTMLAKGDHFQVNGVPVVPVGDDGAWNPYQQMEITVKDSTGAVVASTRATVPTSDEINCAKCHGGGGVDAAFTDILAKHDALQSTSLAASAPVLCASCHGSPALGQSGAGSSGVYLSQAIHGFHADKGASCYDCHPGASTKCSRSTAHTADNGNCTSCHGQMSDVASSVSAGGRVPWVREPACGSCHQSSSAATLTAVKAGAASGIAQVDTGTALYRNAAGHGGMYCAACHGSPHAMLPSREAKDQYQAVQYQGKAVTVASCAACHPTSHGGGFGEFFEEHGGGGDGETSACRVCHTGFTSAASAADAPHEFQWRSR
jgi:hypothetical protein